MCQTKSLPIKVAKAPRASLKSTRSRVPTPPKMKGGSGKAGGKRRVPPKLPAPAKATPANVMDVAPKRGEKRSREQVDDAAQASGRVVRARTDKRKLVAGPRGEFGPKMRILEKMFAKDDWTALRKDADINRIYRAAWKGMDELFSTALTRELIKGMFEKGVSPTDDERERLTHLVDLLSQARISTHNSGFATAKNVFQHPTNRGKARIADPIATAALHSRMDSERRAYVQAALDNAANAGGSATDIVYAGVRAAIEFTLNYFTAPIMAKNVFEHTLRAGQPFTREDQLQHAERERLKIFYEQLGGTLRAANPFETPQQSQVRVWGAGLRIDIDAALDRGDFESAPPSPRRQVDIPPPFERAYGLV